MSTITVTNVTDTLVAGETDLRQAVAEAKSGDTIVLASSNDFGQTIQLKSPLVIAAGANLTIDFGAGKDNEVVGSIIVNAGATATISNVLIIDEDIGANSPDNPANGEGGVGVVGVAAPGVGGQNGGGGGNGASATHPGSDALGAVQNSGKLTLIDDTVDGRSFGGESSKGGNGGDGAGGQPGGDTDTNGPGGNGGNGGSGGPGGAGSAGGNAVGGIYNASGAVLTLEDTFIEGAATGGNGGNGGNGGQGADGGGGGAGDPAGSGGKGGGGGASGASGNGGNAVGGILNDGTIDVVGAAILYGDAATAGTGGVSGQSKGGQGASGGGGNPAGADGADGAKGAIGAAGVSGTANTDYRNNGTINGALTVNGAYVDIENTSSSPVVVEDGSGFVSAVVNWVTAGANALTGATVDWKIVSGSNGPALSDFSSWTGLGSPTFTPGKTSGTLSFTDEDVQSYIQLEFAPKANEPSNETFTIELYDPSSPTVLGSESSLVVNFTNPLAGSGTPPPPPPLTGSNDILWQNNKGEVAFWDLSGATLTGSAVVANPGPTWKAVATGDFNDDGQPDILLQNASGNIAIWETNGGGLLSSAVVADPGPTWKAVATGDFNDDHHSDIILQNTNGNVAIWEMNGTSLTDSATV
ncbi:MAG: VCBS repeat-containing protein, partial [Hyphomicrobiales bacterium]|nr:VCBS repeat-containing protein [Hyphomicrobiales bacterium]